MKKIRVDYDPVSGNIYVAGFTFFIGINLDIDEEVVKGELASVKVAKALEVCKTAKDLIELKKAGLL